MNNEHGGVTRVVMGRSLKPDEDGFESLRPHHAPTLESGNNTSNISN